LTPNEQFRLYAIGFIAGFSLIAADARQQLFERYCELLTNRRSRGTPFTSGMIIECLKGLSLMISLWEPTLSACDCYAEITGVIDRMLGVKDSEVLSQALDLLLLVHESIVEVERLIENGEDCELQESRVQFIGNYGGKLPRIPELVSKKADKQSLLKQCGLVERLFEGEGKSDSEIVLNSQSVEIIGRKRQTVVAAVRRMTKSHFQEQMAANLMIHRFLGITLMSQQQALVIKRECKGEIEYNYIMKKKERELAIAKKTKRRSELH
jgi:hypothetical protein